MCLKLRCFLNSLHKPRARCCPPCHFVSHALLHPGCGRGQVPRVDSRLVSMALLCRACFSPMQLARMSFRALRGPGALVSSIQMVVGIAWCLRQASAVICSRFSKVPPLVPHAFLRLKLQPGRTWSICSFLLGTLMSLLWFCCSRVAVHTVTVLRETPAVRVASNCPFSRWIVVFSGHRWNSDDMCHRFRSTILWTFTCECREFFFYPHEMNKTAER